MHIGGVTEFFQIFASSFRRVPKSEDFDFISLALAQSLYSLFLSEHYKLLEILPPTQYNLVRYLVFTSATKPGKVTGLNSDGYHCIKGTNGEVQEVDAIYGIQNCKYQVTFKYSWPEKLIKSINFSGPDLQVSVVWNELSNILEP